MLTNTMFTSCILYFVISSIIQSYGISQITYFVVRERMDAAISLEKTLFLGENFLHVRPIESGILRHTATIVHQWE